MSLHEIPKRKRKKSSRRDAETLARRESARGDTELASFGTFGTAELGEHASDHDHDRGHGRHRRRAGQCVVLPISVGTLDTQVRRKLGARILRLSRMIECTENRALAPPSVSRCD